MSDRRQPNLEVVPDALAPAPSDVYETVLGGEASVPIRDFAPSADSHFPNPEKRRLEVRDLERLFQARLLQKLPAVPTSGAVRLLARALSRLGMRNRSTVVDRFGRDPARAAQASTLLELAYRRYFRVTVDGADNVPTEGPAILVANRGGVLPLDVVMLMEAVRLEAGRSLRPLVEDTVHHVPVLGVALARIGAVRACRDNAERLLTQREIIAVFPEGANGAMKPYAERYKLRRFGRGGYVRVALAAGAPIIPTAIVGAEDALPTALASDVLGRLFGLPTLPALGLMPLPSKFRIHFGTPIELSPGGDERRAVSEVNATVRNRVQALLDEAKRQRGAAFRL